MTPTTVKLGNEQLEVRPLSIKSLRRVLPLIDQLAKSRAEAAAASPEEGGASAFAKVDVQMDTIIDIAFTALLPAKPGLTKDWLEENVTLADIPGLLAAITSASGLVRVAPGEPANP